MVAIIENFQTKDGHIEIPRQLQKYVGKKTI
jgi:seryl-tRNA synthetase